MLLVQRGATSGFRHDCSAAALAASAILLSDLFRDALSWCCRVTVRPVSFKSMEQGRQSVVLNWMSQEISNEAKMDIDGQRCNAETYPETGVIHWNERRMEQQYGTCFLEDDAQHI